MRVIMMIVISLSYVDLHSKVSHPEPVIGARCEDPHLLQHGIALFRIREAGKYERVAISG